MAFAKVLAATVSLAVLAFLLGGCAATGFPPQTAQETAKVPAEKRIELALAPASFDVTEVEFHVDKETLPVIITRRAKEVMPEGEITDAEIEYHGEEMFYEVTCMEKGVNKEALFMPDGQVQRWEITVTPDTVPPVLLERAKNAVAGAELVQSEQILNADQSLLAYHFKLQQNGIKYKIVIPSDPEKSMVVYRETLAEVEVPMK